MKTISKKRKPENSGSKTSSPFFDKAAEQAFFTQTQKTQVPFFTVQPKLTIGQPNDRYEQEADAMANQVINKTTAPEKSVAKTPEIQSKCPACEEEELQSKSNEDQPATASPEFESKLKSSGNGGESLPESVKQEMEAGFGADFSNVNIHTGEEAEKLSSAINAVAFTCGNDIYFNKGKYNPETTEGKHLLAHELTHTLQQGGEPIKKLDDPKISTPIPDKATKDNSTGVHKLTINGVEVEIHPDVFIKGEKGGETAFEMIPQNRSWDGYDMDSDGLITAVKNPPNVPKIVIKTTYGLEVKPGDPSAYGRGTTAEDKKAGNTSIRFHEGSHGTDCLKYLADNPFPKFPDGVGMKKADFLKAVEKYTTQRKEFSKKMDEFSEKRTDCVGYTIDKYHQDNAKKGETFPIVCGS